MTLEPTFSLTPRDSNYHPSYNQFAGLNIYGANFFPKYNESYRKSFDHQHTADELYFDRYYAVDPTLDYSIWTNRRTAPHINLHFNLSPLGENKELALVFGFDAESDSRLLVFTHAGLQEDVSLVRGDNQFLIEVESLDFLSLYFIHSRVGSSSRGGHWFFKGITGYVV